MMYHHVRVIAIFLVASVLLQVTKSEFFTAIAELEKLLNTGGEIVKGLKRYLEVEEQRLKKLKWHSDQYEELYKYAITDVDTFLWNPVNAYLLVKRLTTDWEAANKLIDNLQSRTEINEVIYPTLNFPNNEDLKGAATALLRLQDLYLLDTATMARGQIKGAKISSQLTAGDCYEMGKQAFQTQEFFNHTLDWMEESLNRLEAEDVKTANITDVLEYMAFTAYTQKNYTYAMQLTERLIELDPSISHAYVNLQNYKILMENEEERRKANKYVIEEEAQPVIFSYDDTFLDPAIIKAYERLCRGESLKTAKEESKLHCYYTTNNNSYLLLQPVKVEVLNLNPRVVVYHDVLTAWESEVIKFLAMPQLSRATVTNATSGMGDYASYRISKSAWLDDHEHPFIPRINRRVEYITGLDSTTAEALHVINYGIGGYYDSHFDYAMPYENVPYMKNLGNRISTWIFYLSDVPAGGSTVFPTLGVEVKPLKGSAVFWHNLMRNGKGDNRTRHAACPVLTGSKWVANKWIHEFRNEFRRTCSLDPVE